jgi:hypothetical protein
MRMRRRAGGGLLLLLGLAGLVVVVVIALFLRGCSTTLPVKATAKATTPWSRMGPTINKQQQQQQH